MNHKHLLAGVAVAALMTTGSAFAASHSGGQDQLAAQAAMIDALSKKVEALSANAGVDKGVKGVSLKISGQVTRAVFFGNDANDNSFFNFVDNDASSTRVRWDASAPMGDGLKVGSRLEMEMESNTSIRIAGSGGVGGDVFAARQAYVFVSGSFGTLSTGHQSEASDGVLHNSFNYASLADMNPEFTAGTLGMAGARLPSFGDGGRVDSIQYATPSIAGFKAAVSIEDQGQLTAQGTYSGDLGGVGVLAGLGYEAEQGATDAQMAGSMGLNFGPVALNGAFAVNLDDSAGGSDKFFYYLSLTHKGSYIDLGSTSLAIDFGNANGVIDGIGAFTSVGFGVVQGVAPGADMFFSVRHYNEGDRGVDSAIASLLGMRVVF